MDELRFKQRGIKARSLRRLALFAAINCSLIAPAGSWCRADDPQELTQNLRGLLAEGWASEPTLSEHTSSEPTSSNKVQPETLPAPAPISMSSQGANRLKPITIDAAEDISAFAHRELSSTLSYGDIPARTIFDKTDPPSVPAYELPLLPPPSENASPRSLRLSDQQSGDRKTSSLAFTMPESLTTKPESVERGISAGNHRQSSDNVALQELSFDRLKSHALRSIASEQGFGLLGKNTTSQLPERRYSPTKSPRSQSAAKTVSRRKQDARHADVPGGGTMSGKTIHASKLGEIAAVQLQDAQGRLRRGATHGAKQLAIGALQNLVALQDVRQGDNRNAQHLDTALTAIRESEDFSGKFGTVDQRVLQRLVVAHRTSVLKGRDLSHVSAMRATESYLAIAREEIVKATASIGLASDALVLLGRIEATIADPSDPRGGAVALSLQQAAVEVDPANSRAWLELGTTMMNEGLLQESVEILSRSVELQPSRRGYETLLTVASHLQDAGTVQRCQVALKNPSLNKQIPVRKIDQEAFAALYKPTNSIARNATSDKPASPAVSQPVEAKPVSTKTKKFGLLRSWMMPKKSR
ncbi:hypothetical protein [Planctomycetes bacterium K23_9]|uniref:Uncharacterized protein n=1 Tax=Stieleria marina TaxID=1930275 RepID=A0A517NND5_9BACT|nr:hypothetical protein K239x_05850 [Planctomycetes bacterium K23_9]